MSKNIRQRVEDKINKMHINLVVYLPQNEYIDFIALSIHNEQEPGLYCWHNADVYKYVACGNSKFTKKVKLLYGCTTVYL